MMPVEVVTGDGPIVLGLPHTGTFVPDDIAERLNDKGRMLADTDWHVDRLYNGLLPEVTTVRATFHRYVIDANRDPGGKSLYPGQNTTGLVPLTDFDGREIWRDPPGEKDVESRRVAFHLPYHSALSAELQRLKAAHGVAILFDCHSIRSHIPYLFEGRLPDFNIGTNHSKTCDAQIETATKSTCEQANGFSTVLNGRFKGGWSTRHYGQPSKGIHAIQMELSQSTYLSEECPPWTYDIAKARRLRPHLRCILENLVQLAINLGENK